MKRYLTLMAFMLLVVAVGWGARPAAAADAIVGTGTPASCTEAAFDAAITTAEVGGGTITFNCGPSETTIPLTTTKSIVLGNVTIDGDDRIILNAGNNDRHFFVGLGVTFTLRQITLRDGNSLVGGGAIEASGADVVLDSVQLINNYSVVSGGAIYCFDGTLTMNNSLLENNAADFGGAIFNDGCEMTIQATQFLGNQALNDLGRGGAIANMNTGVLRLTNAVVQANTGLDGGGLFNDGGATAEVTDVQFIANEGGYGGGIENSGTLLVVACLFDQNTVSGTGGGLWNLGGTVDVQQTTFRNNTAPEGGGVSNYGSQVTMTDVNLIDNAATGSHGGGLYHGGGTMVITNATISGNEAGDPAANGGGIYQNSDDNLTMTNVTLAENRAGQFGGGLYHYGRYAILTNVTIANNLAGAAGDAIYEESPLTPANPGVVQLANSVIFGSANNCDGTMVQSLGHNISQGTCAGLDQATDQDNFTGNLRLGPLALHGGDFPMRTILPQAGSPLIDAADPGQCPVRDQRGFEREGVCDIGAVEYQEPVEYLLYLPSIMR